MVQHDHAVRHELFDAVSGQLVRSIALSRQDRGQPLILEPAKQPANLGAQDAGVR